MSWWNRRQTIHYPTLLVGLYGNLEPETYPYRGRVDFTLGHLPQESVTLPLDYCQEIVLLNRAGRLSSFLDTGPRAVWKDSETYVMLSGCQEKPGSKIVSYVAVTISKQDSLCCIATKGCESSWGKHVMQTLSVDLRLKPLGEICGAGHGHVCLSLNVLAQASQLYNKGGTFPFLEKHPESAGFLQHHRVSECSLS